MWARLGQALHAASPVFFSFLSFFTPLSATRIQKRLLASLNFFLLPSYFTLFMRVCGRKKDRKSNISSEQPSHLLSTQPGLEPLFNIKTNTLFRNVPPRQREREKENDRTGTTGREGRIQ